MAEEEAGEDVAIVAEEESTEESAQVFHAPQGLK